MAAATQQSAQAITGAPLYETDHKPLTVLGIRPTGTLPVAGGETIDMVKVPAGARIIDAYMWCDANGYCDTVDLGLWRIDTDAVIDADGLIKTGVLGVAGFKGKWTGAAEELLMGSLLAYDSYVRATFNTDKLTDACNFYVVVTYIMP